MEYLYLALFIYGVMRLTFKSNRRWWGYIIPSFVMWYGGYYLLIEFMIPSDIIMLLGTYTLLAIGIRQGYLNDTQTVSTSH